MGPSFASTLTDIRAPGVHVRVRLLWMLTPAFLSIAFRASADPVTIATSQVLNLFSEANLPGRAAFGLTPVPFDPPAIRLFEDRVLTTADIGHSIRTDANTESDFNDFVTLLTDGKPSFTSLFLEGGGVETLFEGILFHLPPGVVDFHGFRITAAELLLEPFPSHAGSPLWNLRVSVIGIGPEKGVTPEPASIVLLASGLLGILCLRVRRPVN